MKKEVNAITNLALELPQSNGLRKTMGQYKTRFEEAIDELLGFFILDITFMQHASFVYHLCPKVEKHQNGCQYE